MSLAYPPFHRDLAQVQPDGRLVVDEQWHDFFRSFVDAFNSGASTTVTLAKITGGGANGSLVVTNGLVTSVTQPT